MKSKRQTTMAKLERERRVKERRERKLANKRAAAEAAREGRTAVNGEQDPTES